MPKYRPNIPQKGGQKGGQMGMMQQLQKLQEQLTQAQEQLALRTASEDGLQVIVTRSFNHTGPRLDPSP